MIIEQDYHSESTQYYATAKSCIALEDVHTLRPITYDITYDRHMTDLRPCVKILPVLYKAGG